MTRKMNQIKKNLQKEKPQKAKKTPMEEAKKEEEELSHQNSKLTLPQIKSPQNQDPTYITSSPKKSSCTSIPKHSFQTLPSKKPPSHKHTSSYTTTATSSSTKTTASPPRPKNHSKENKFHTLSQTESTPHLPLHSRNISLTPLQNTQKHSSSQIYFHHLKSCSPLLLPKGRSPHYQDYPEQGALKPILPSAKLEYHKSQYQKASADILRRKKEQMRVQAKKERRMLRRMQRKAEMRNQISACKLLPPAHMKISNNGACKVLSNVHKAHVLYKTDLHAFPVPLPYAFKQQTQNYNNLHISQRRVSNIQ